MGISLICAQDGVGVFPLSTLRVFSKVEPTGLSHSTLLPPSPDAGSVASITRQPPKGASPSLEVVIVYKTQEEAQEALRHLDGGALFGSALYVRLQPSAPSFHEYLPPG